VTGAAVPVKDLTGVKQRLVDTLTPAERAALAGAMLRDVLRALGAAGLDVIWVVTHDPEVGEIARTHGGEVLAEPTNRGHTAAVALAQAHAERLGAATFVTVPGDVPCVAAAEVRELVVAARSRWPAAVFAPSRSGLGTNGVALSPPGAMPLRFGEPSFEDHLAAARSRRLTPRVLSLPGLGLDIDAPGDLALLVEQGSATESGQLVAGWGLAGRLLLRRAAGGHE
jgi:2-phospho-L-lactate guanylyltransferase